jgi:hypothetical protein
MISGCEFSVVDIFCKSLNTLYRFFVKIIVFKLIEKIILSTKNIYRGFSNYCSQLEPLF